MHVAQECLANVSPEQFWSIADNFPDLVKCLHVQIRLAGNFGLNGGVPWLSNTEGALCFICKENVENVNHFLLECREFRNNFDSIWLNLTLSGPGGGGGGSEAWMAKLTAANQKPLIL